MDVYRVFWISHLDVIDVGMELTLAVDEISSQFYRRSGDKTNHPLRPKFQCTFQYDILYPGNCQLKLYLHGTSVAIARLGEHLCSAYQTVKLWVFPWFVVATAVVTAVHTKNALHICRDWLYILSIRRQALFAVDNVLKHVFKITASRTLICIDSAAWALKLKLPQVFHPSLVSPLSLILEIDPHTHTLHRKEWKRYN
ncbi:unnamed protein product [Sympodiomycopsis kandeliae]